MPQNGPLPADMKLSAEPVPSQTQVTPESNVLQEPAPVQPAGPSLVKRLSSDPSECASVPVAQVGRPMPMPKTKAMSKPATKSNVGLHLKKMLFGSQNTSLDPRQKKTAVLVGVLSVVFAAVMFVSFGGVGKTQAAPSKDTAAETAGQSQAAKKTAENWKNPDPLPQDLRNATSPVQVHSNPQPDNSDTETGALTVKGILFSNKNPSAIINDKILSEGQTINGVTVVKITKETVEFEANEKRWAQKVQR